jgi:FkbM family methyltransferase
MGLYRRTRNLYQRLLNRQYWQHRQAQRRLYGEFVRSGSIAFDIGANRGEISEAFLELGAATIVAVEPNEALAGEIRRRLGQSVTVERAAVGSRAGEADLVLGRDSGHSTLSREWIARAPSDDRWAGEVVRTPVTTLDALIEKHGHPDFVKIDVEAYEAEVLGGLTGDVQALSFEYQAAYIEVAMRCLDRLGAKYEYALTRGEEPVLRTSWMSCEQVRDELSRLAPESYGDVFARLVAGAR